MACASQGNESLGEHFVGCFILQAVDFTQFVN